MTATGVTDMAQHWRWDARSGRLEAGAELSVALFWGYSAYTSFRLPLSRRWQEAHWERLGHDAARLGLALDSRAFEPLWAMQAGLDARSDAVAVIRWTLAPEAASFRQFVDAPSGEALASRLLVTLSWMPNAADDSLPVIDAWGLPGGGPWDGASVKHGSMLPALLARREARGRGFDDVVYLYRQATGPWALSEASTASVVAVAGDRLLTPDAALSGCLPGVSVRRLPAEPATLAVEALSDVRRLLLVNAVQGLRVVRTLRLFDGRAFTFDAADADGRLAAWQRRLVSGD